MSLSIRQRLAIDRAGARPARSAGDRARHRSCTAATVRDVANRAIDHVLGSVRYHSDRDLVPRSSEPVAPGCALSVRSGACGIAHVLVHTGRACPTIVDWIRRRATNLSDYPPGLMDGLAGIAWTLSELGSTDEGRKAIALAVEHPRLSKSAGVYDGISGLGLAALWMHTRTNDVWHLDVARCCGRCLADTVEHDANGACWRAADGAVAMGYGHGASGVAAFLLYLYVLTGEWRWLMLGRDALEADLRRAGTGGDRAAEGASDGAADSPSDGSAEGASGALARATSSDARLDPTSGVEHGLAGLAGVLIRYYAVLGLDAHKRALRILIERVSGDRATGVGYTRGLAGVGQLFVDLAVLCRDETARTRAWQMADRIVACAVQTPLGVTFADWNRADRTVDCDFADGGAGVALFLHRLCTRRTSSFMLDGLFDRASLQPFW